MSQSISYGHPKCPNHEVDLMLTGKPGLGICPVSNCEFEYEAFEQQKKKQVDTNGNVIQTYKVRGDEK